MFFWKNDVLPARQRYATMPPTPVFGDPWAPGAARKTLFELHQGERNKKRTIFVVFFLHLAFESFFLAFWTSKGPSRTTKNHENHVTVIKKQGFAIFEKIHFQGRFYYPWGALWASFWSPLRSLGLLLAPFGPPKRFKNRKKRKQMTS